MYISLCLYVGIYRVRLFTYLPVCVLPLQSASPGSAEEDAHPGVIGRIKEAVGSVFKGSHKVCMHAAPKRSEFDSAIDVG